MENKINQFAEEIAMKEVYSFTKSDKTINEFIKEHNLSYKFFFSFYKKYVLKNYVRIFKRPFHFAKYLNEHGVTRNKATKFKSEEKLFHYISDVKLTATLPKAINKWIQIQEAEDEIQKKLYDLALKNTAINDKELIEFSQKWNITERNYENIRAYCIKKGLLVVKKAFVVRPLEEVEKEFAKKIKIEDKKMVLEIKNLTKKNAKKDVDDFIKYYFEGKIKSLKTIKSFNILNIPLNASIKEIKELIK